MNWNTRKGYASRLAAWPPALLLATLGGLASAAPGDGVLEEIVVVATKAKTAERLQDVPIAITAITGDTLEQSGVEDIYSLQEQAPALVASRSQQATTASFAIRGVGTSSQNFGLESSVGVYVDDVYRARQSSIINNLVDLEDVEILRGPQGTLFGKNTPSGAIIMRTVSPAARNGLASDELNGFLEVSGGDYGLVNLSAATNIPVTQDVFALHATLFKAKRDGTVDEVTFAGSDAINNLDRRGGRLQALYTPNDRLEVRVIADDSKIDEICCAALTRQDSIVAFGRDDGAGGPVYGTDSVLLLLGGHVFTGKQFDDRKMALNHLPVSENEDRGLSVAVTYDFDTATLTSITAVRSFDTFDDIDADFSDVDLFSKQNDSTQKSFSEELRLAGDLNDSTSYVVGLYYFTQDLDADNKLTIGPLFNSYIEAVNSDLAGVIQFVDGISAATGGLLPAAGDPYVNGGYAREIMKQDHRSWATFAQFNYAIADELRLTAGLRYTNERKKLDGRFLENTLGAAPDLTTVLTEVATFMASPGTYNPLSAASMAALNPIRVDGWGHYLLDVLSPRPDIDKTLNDSQVSGTIKLSWDANDSTLVYVSYGTGYKSGGTNTDRINAAFNPVFGPETSRSLEVGVKADFDRARVNVALHRTDVDELQANSFTGLGFNLQNAGSAKTHGAEVEALWLATENLTVQAAYTWSVATFDTFRKGTCWVATPFHTGEPDPGLTVDPTTGATFCDRSGDRLPSNPEQNLYLAVNANFPLGNAMRFFVRPEYAYYSDEMTDGNNEPLKLKASHSLWNLRAGVELEQWDASIVFWGRNLTDEQDYETVFDVPIQDGKLNAYPHDPRTYGLTFRKNF